MYGDGDPYDGLAAVERRGRDQTVVGRLYHQLAAPNLDNQDDKDDHDSINHEGWGCNQLVVGGFYHQFLQPTLLIKMTKG